ncbi:MAG TPA: NUDIX domain-containing protein [Patescibacteria group bacterium]|nr:NUDIX domain-containing protein [Patescibacteria group bacterium]
MKDKFPRGIEVITGALIRNNEGLLLFTQSPKWDNHWIIPGGHVEPGETIQEATIREVMEETGLIAKPIILIHFGELINPPGFHRLAHFIFFTYLCQVNNGSPSLDQQELTNYCWVTPADALKLKLGGPNPEVVRKYIAFVAKEEIK